MFVGSPARGLGVLYSDTLSVRDVVGHPRPTVSLTARVLGDGGSAPPRVRTLPSSFVRLCLGSHVRSLSRLISAEPRAPAATCPLGHSPVFPHADERHVYFVDSFIQCS